jgi:hypothetical protein
MLSTVIATVIVMGLLIAGMAIGIIMGKSPIKGTCGGLSAMALDENGSCHFCGGKPQDCDSNGETKLLTDQRNLGYDATKNVTK